MRLSLPEPERSRIADLVGRHHITIFPRLADDAGHRRHHPVPALDESWQDVGWTTSADQPLGFLSDPPTSSRRPTAALAWWVVNRKRLLRTPREKAVADRHELEALRRLGRGHDLPMPELKW